jgi:hypothetical protein
VGVLAWLLFVDQDLPGQLREAFARLANAIGERNGLLIDFKFFEAEGHRDAQQKRRGESSE